MKDLYNILGVERNATQEEIKKAYFEKAKQYHPDHNPGNHAFEEIFKEVNNAYDVLKDPQKRSVYDQGGATTTNGPFGFNSSGFSVNPNGFSNTEDINDILNNIFNQSGFRKQQVYQNQNINLNYQITLEDAFNGKETEISFSYKQKNQTLKLAIPAGIENGMKIRYAKRGEDSLQGVPPGDLFVTIGIIPHNVFTRLDRGTLLIRKEIDYLDAITGRDLEVPTIEGSIIKLAIPPDSRNSTILKAAGKGMKLQNDIRGDMLIEIQLQPPILSKAQRELVTQIKALSK
jgi:DnaJ-class molecular chaperone